MLKDLLLNYIMGKYRKYLTIFSIVFCTLCTIRYYFVMNLPIYIPEMIILLFTPAPFVLTLFNVPVLGMPSINKSSSGLDVNLRVCGLMATLILMCLYALFTFCPNCLNSH
ncbi:hypothetical protein [Acinetobacter sp. WZC-1]|uniref:hypothetical protein n=1 Tax=Acinetobacter sp. WZC-1 TaxID=3459034 RepID=UPI00403D7E7A